MIYEQPGALEVARLAVYAGMSRLHLHHLRRLAGQFSAGTLTELQVIDHLRDLQFTGEHLRPAAGQST